MDTLRNTGLLAIDLSALISEINSCSKLVVGEELRALARLAADAGSNDEDLESWAERLATQTVGIED